jgi:hypothetical protein
MMKLYRQYAVAFVLGKFARGMTVGTWANLRLPALVSIPCLIAAEAQGQSEAPGARWQPPSEPAAENFVPSTEQRREFDDFGGWLAIRRRRILY